MHPAGETPIIIDVHAQGAGAITIVVVRNDGGINRKLDGALFEHEPWMVRAGTGHRNARDSVHTCTGRID